MGQFAAFSPFMCLTVNYVAKQTVRKTSLSPTWGFSPLFMALGTYPTKLPCQAWVN